MRANPPMIRFLASIGFAVHKVRPLIYNPKEIEEAERLRREIRQITDTGKGRKSG